MWLARFTIGLVLRGGLVLLGGLMQPGGPALAATGDALIVTGNGVNVRSGPSGDASVRMRVYRNQQVIELQRQGEWVRAEIAGTGGEEGWIHRSLLARPDGEALPDRNPVQAPSGEAAATAEEAAPADDAAEADEQPLRARGAPLPIEPAAGPDAAPGELARFRETVRYLNGRAVALTGADLFKEVKPGAGGVVQVLATEAWSTITPAGRQTYANTLLDRWAATEASAGPVTVQIVDPKGEVVMEKTGPGTERPPH